MSKKAFLIITLIFLSFHALFFLTRHHDIHWDEAVYISMGKFFYSFGKEGLFETIRPPGLPLLLGGLWKSGLGTMRTYHFLILFFGMGVLFLNYLLTKETIHKEAAVAATSLLAITPFFVQGSFSILSEIPSTFFILLTLWLLVQKKHPFLMGITASVAFLFKFPAGILLLAILIIFIIQTPTKKILGKHSPCIPLLFGFLLIQLPYLSLNYTFYKDETGNVFDAVFRPFLFAKEHEANAVHAIAGSIQNYIYYPKEIFKNNPLLIFAFFGFILLCVQKEIRKKALLYGIPCFLFLFYFTVIANKQLRFAIVFVPFIAMLAGYGLSTAITTIQCWTKTKKIVFILALLLIAGYLLYPQFLLVYQFFPEKELPIEQMYYNYFKNNNLSGSILTTEPYFSAYTDQILAIPYYNNASDAREIYERYKKNVDYIVWTTDFYPCMDEQCKQELAGLEENIQKNNVLLYEEEWNDKRRTIWKVQ